MKPRRNLFLGTLVVIALSQNTQAADYWWNTDTGSWGDTTKWSDAATGGTTGTVPTATDSAIFNQSDPEFPHLGDSR